MPEALTERGQTTLMLGGEARLIWFNNRARRMLERLEGSGILGYFEGADAATVAAGVLPPRLANRVGFDFCFNLIKAGMAYRDQGMPSDAEVDGWMDDLRMDPDDPDVVKGDAESLAGAIAKLMEALGNALSPPKKATEGNDKAEPQPPDEAAHKA